jgi:hypothetical protein
MTTISWLNVFHKLAVVTGTLVLVMIVSGVESLLRPRPQISFPLITNYCEKNSVAGRSLKDRGVCSGEKFSSLTKNSDSNFMKN